MIKKTMTFIDYDGNERTEDFWFNLNKAEVAKMELGTTGGIQKMIERLVQEQDSARIVEIFDQMICASYGKKSPDGKRFIKSQDLLDEFKQTEAYSDLFIELLGHPDMASAFFNEVLPKMDDAAPDAKTGVQMTIV